MITISLCMIVKNEEDVLARCLKSAQGIADEIIIADTGSADRTKEIAGQFTEKVYDYEWKDDFAAARNFAFSKAGMDYIMWLDADDVLLPKDLERIRQLKEELDPAVSVVMMKYDVAFDENGKTTFSYYRERLVKNGEGFLWQGRVHEVIPPRGKIEYSDAAVTHQKTRPGDPERNLRIFEKMIQSGEALDPRQQFYYGRELYYHERYEEAIAVFEGFLDGGQGWSENCIDACRLLAQCYENSGKAGNSPGETGDGKAQERDTKALSALFRSFAYDIPRAETCCDIGKKFMERGEYRTAAWWYERAAESKRPDAGGGFVSLDCYDYIPYLQLCVCYDRLGERELALQYHKKAQKIKPNDPAVLYNEEYFAKKSGNLST